MPSTRSLLFFAITWYAALALFTLIAFALDKSRAQRPGARRIPERTLHTCSVLGGFPGALLAMWIIRHKNHKPWFVAITLAFAALHIAAWIAVIVLLWK